MKDEEPVDGMEGLSHPQQPLLPIRFHQGNLKILEYEFTVVDGSLMTRIFFELTGHLENRRIRIHRGSVRTSSGTFSLLPSEGFVLMDNPPLVRLNKELLDFKFGSQVPDSIRFMIRFICPDSIDLAASLFPLHGILNVLLYIGREKACPEFPVIVHMNVLE